jgi:hypothetical protein
MKGVARDASNERSDEVEHQQPRPGPEHEVLEVIIGKWINEGHTVGPHGETAAQGPEPITLRPFVVSFSRVYVLGS